MAVTLRLSPQDRIGGAANCNDVGGKELTWAASSDTGETCTHNPSEPTIITVAGCNDVSATRTETRFWRLMANACGWYANRGDLFIRLTDGTTAQFKPIEVASARSGKCQTANQNDVDCLRKTIGGKTTMTFGRPTFDGIDAPLFSPRLNRQKSDCESVAAGAVETPA